MRFGIKGVIVRDGKILLIKRSNYDSYGAGNWDLPGGRLEKDEGAFAGHKREVMEESGIEIEILEPVRTWFVQRPDGEHVGITLLDRFVSGEVRLSHEHTEHKWLLPKDVKKLDNVPEWLVQEAERAVELNPNLFAKHL